MDNIFAITFDQKETETIERAYKRSNCKTKNEFFELLVTRFFEELDEDTSFTMYFERNTTPSINRFIAFIENKFGLNNNPPKMFNSIPFPFPAAGVLTSMGKTYFAHFNDETVSKLIELTNCCPNYNIMMSNLSAAIIATKADSFDSDEKHRQEKMTMEKISKVKPDFDGDTLDIPKLSEDLSYNYDAMFGNKSGYYFDNDKISEIIKAGTSSITNSSTKYVITSVERAKRPRECNRIIMLNKTTPKKKQKQFADMLLYYKETMERLIERIVIESLIINKECCDQFIKCSIKVSGFDTKTAINSLAKEIGVEVKTTKIPTAYKFVVNSKTGEIFYPENLQVTTTI